jgi:hemerythrin HHE cation binding domain-containing protein
MTGTPANPGARIYEEFLAVHTVLRRGTALVADAFDQAAGGSRVDAAILAETARWLVDFTHYHHVSEDDLFWPVLCELYPHTVAQFDVLAAEHEALSRELTAVSAVVDQLEAAAAAAGSGGVPVPGRLARDGAAMVRRLQSVLEHHLGAEEPVVKDLFTGVPGDEVDRLRKAILEAGPRSGAHLLFGLLSDPALTYSGECLIDNFPPAFRSMQPQLMQRYLNSKKDLGLTPV